MRSGEYKGCSSTVMCCLPKTVSQRVHCVPRHCLDENPCVVAPQIRPLLPQSFSMLSQDLDVVLLVYRLALRYPFNHDDTINIEKNYEHALLFGLAHSYFFGPWECRESSVMDCRLVSGLY